MKHLFKSAITAFFIICFFFSNVYAIDKRNFPVTPKMNNGKKWRVGYLEGGPLPNYPDNLRALVDIRTRIDGGSNVFKLSNHEITKSQDHEIQMRGSVTPRCD